jgi:hypothetical protein
METSAQTREQTASEGGTSRSYWAYRIALGSALVVALLAVAFTARKGSERLARSEGRFPHHRSAVAAYSASERNSRLLANPLFPYSIIPGGAHSAKELRNAVAHDAVVASHYADFDLEKARIVRLDRDRTVYVSYRLGDRVYWTTKKLTLLRGEKIITDGKHEARTRCGNRISEAPAEPVSSQEPSEEAMEVAPVLDRFPSEDPAVETPPISPADLVRPMQTPPENPPGGVFIPPPIFPIIGGGSPPLSPPLPPPYPPPIATPEPDTWVLLGVGVSVCVSFGLRARIR